MEIDNNMPIKFIGEDGEIYYKWQGAIMGQGFMDMVDKEIKKRATEPPIQSLPISQKTKDYVELYKEIKKEMLNRVGVPKTKQNESKKLL